MKMIMIAMGSVVATVTPMTILIPSVVESINIKTKEAEDRAAAEAKRIAAEKVVEAARLQAIEERKKTIILHKTWDKIPVGFKMPLKIAKDEFGLVESVPEDVDFSKITDFGDGAFKKLKKLPDDLKSLNVTSIGNDVFSGLTSIPKDLNLSKIKSIGDNAFMNVKSLPKNIKFTSLIHIGQMAFKSLQHLPDDIDFKQVTSIGLQAFIILQDFPAKLKFEHLETIGMAAFHGLRRIPNGAIDFSTITSIGLGAFMNAILPDEMHLASIINIGSGAFQNTSKLPTNFTINKLFKYQDAVKGFNHIEDNTVLKSLQLLTTLVPLNSTADGELLVAGPGSGHIQLSNGIRIVHDSAVAIVKAINDKSVTTVKLVFGTTTEEKFAVIAALATNSASKHIKTVTISTNP